MKALLLAAALFAVGLLPQAAKAEIWAAGGLLFSDELGGFKIISVSGHGTTEDPIVIVEELIRLGTAILVIRVDKEIIQPSLDLARTNYVNTALVKIVTNGTRRVWSGFDLELRQDLKKPSPYGDGLSFDQMGSFRGLVAHADRFASTSEVSEPFDRVLFTNGSVDPGRSVTMSLYITDPTPVSEFYLFQEPKLLIADNGPAVPRHSLAQLPCNRTNVRCPDSISQSD